MKYENITSELDKRFAPKKSSSLVLADYYKSISNCDTEYKEYFDKKSSRVRACGGYLEFSIKKDNSASLTSANFCKDPLCPMCAWRKSMKLKNQVYECVKGLKGQYRFIFITLTIKNCKDFELRNTIKHLNKSFSRLLRRKKLSFVKGGFKAVEITYNKNTDEYHPHIHAIFVVRKSYFTGSSYLKTSELVNEWQKALKVDYQPLCFIENVRRKKGSKKSALACGVAEVAKYPIKSADYTSSDYFTNCKVVRTLSLAVSNVRMFQFWGVLADIRKKLKLEDENDLVHIETKDKADDVLYKVCFEWINGQYVCSGVRETLNE